MCFTLGSSIAEIVSAYPTCGGLYALYFSFILLVYGFKQLTMTSYTASAYLVPREHRARVRIFLRLHIRFCRCGPK